MVNEGKKEYFIYKCVYTNSLNDCLSKYLMQRRIPDDNYATLEYKQ